MKAIAVYPGQPDLMHLEDLAMPQVSEIAGGRGVLVKVLPALVFFCILLLVFHLSGSVRKVENKQ